MFQNHFNVLLGLCLCLFAQTSHADELVRLETRPGIANRYWWMPRDAAKANLILISGGGGGIGMNSGKPGSDNFLIRSRELFASSNPKGSFNVAILGNANDMREMNPQLRSLPTHIQDIEAFVAHVRARNSAPIWIVGTSQGAISAAAAAIELGAKIDGLVLPAPITAAIVPNSVPNQAIDKLRIPVLVVFHEKDSCRMTRPDEAKNIISKLVNVQIKKSIVLQGGKDPVGNECHAVHWHGFINSEPQAAQAITDWILNPTN